MNDALKGYCALCGDKVLYVVCREPRFIQGGKADEGCDILDAAPAVYNGKLGYLLSDDPKDGAVKVCPYQRVPRHKPHRCGSRIRKGTKTFIENGER